MREYERALTTVANSYVQPQVARYVGNLVEPAVRAGSAGRSVDPAQRRRTGSRRGRRRFAGDDADVRARPAASPVRSGWPGRPAARDLLTFDMGGTSTDVALVQDLKPRTGRETKIGDLTVRASSVDVRTVGAGGGSIAHVPELTKALRVGPQSAGAAPGPAGYGLGGTRPDRDRCQRRPRVSADVAGRRRDHPGRRRVPGRGADRSPMRWACPAWRPLPPASSTSSTRTCSAACAWSASSRASIPRDFALVAFGGAGPLHANAMGVLTGAWPVIVPPSPGVLCALGDATTSLRDESARTCLRRFADLTGAELRDILTDLSDAASTRLVAQGLKADEHHDRLRGRRALLRTGFRDPDHHSRRPGSRTWTASCRTCRPPSTPSTSGCSPSC